VIGLQKVITAREYQNKLIFNQGIGQGKEFGCFALAIKLKYELGIDETVTVTGFSKQEL
jgi:hypothetical protein